MTEPNGEKPEVKPESQEEPQGDEFDKDRAMATIKKLRGIESEAEKEIRRLKEENEQLAKAEEERKKAEMSEIEKLQADYEAEKAEREKLLNEIAKRDAERERNKMQREAAQKVELPLEFADRLKGETPEDMEADAKKLLEAMPTKPKPRVTSTNPAGGAGGSGGETDAERRIRLGL